jgi:hypothetical protein
VTASQDDYSFRIDDSPLTLAATISTLGPLTAKSNNASKASRLPLCISAGGNFEGDLLGVRSGLLGDFFFVGVEGVLVAELEPMEGLVSSWSSIFGVMQVCKFNLQCDWVVRSSWNSLDKF